MSVDSAGTWTLARPQLVVFIDDRAIFLLSFSLFFLFTITLFVSNRVILVV